jgi:hypothetical protein
VNSELARYGRSCPYDLHCTVAPFAVGVNYISYTYPEFSRKDVGRDSSVGIATRYELEGPGIDSRWGRDFPHMFRQALRPTEPPVQWVPGLSWG